ncbi:hypothetical protein PVT68_17810 [Microbulbifer bruguierae]|uniref:Uncharacterized protein n=1 Tax=Microbulbifer bruguierae TaxID=3029061 RepID=A0ABY8NDC0_9GAMM|nr:hypothetical protein [Microbulbifer bruguierae]WGL16602.1 hypothetical protein PVT68_17810 [Microbulbifer bruguierae]
MKKVMILFAPDYLLFDHGGRCRFQGRNFHKDGNATAPIAQTIASMAAIPMNRTACGRFYYTHTRIATAQPATNDGSSQEWVGKSHFRGTKKTGDMLRFFVSRRKLSRAFL